MKLHYAAASPFVRKVRITAAELGLDDRIELVDGMTTPVDTRPSVAEANPLGKIPALETDDGTVLYDSPVICEYLVSLADSDALLPATGAERWKARRLEALSDGIKDAAILRRYEKMVRADNMRSTEWDQGQADKITRALDALEREADTLGDAPTLGTIAVGCALGYLDFRFADEDWRPGRPTLAAWYAAWSERPSMKATEPHA